MGLRVDAETFLAAAPELRRAGVRRIDYEADGSIRSVEFYASSDTIPVPSSSGIHSVRDVHPELYPPEEPTSDKIARECGLIEQLCAGARVIRQ